MNAHQIDLHKGYKIVEGSTPMSRAAAIGLLVFCLSGCSKFQILYQNVDYLIEWKVEDYLNQTEEDRQGLRKNIEKLIKWHRSEMLLSYSRFLDKQIFVLKKGNVSKRQIIAAVKTTRGLLEKTLKGVAPFIAAVLERHTAQEKVSYIAERLKAEEMEESERLLENSDAGKKRNDRIVANFERLVGNLNKAQLKLVELYVNATEKNALYWHNRRIDLRKKLVTFLRQDPPKNKIEVFLVNLFSNKGADTIPEAWWTHFTDLLISIVGSLEQTQIIKLVYSLETYSLDMRVIAQKK